MSQEIKKVLVVAVEGVDGREAYEEARAGNLPNLARTMVEGATLVNLAADPSAGSSWASLATGAHAVTHGVIRDEVCQAEYLWQAAERMSKRTLLLDYPASALPTDHEEHPAELLNPPSRDQRYYAQLASYLLSSPDWDIALVRVPADRSKLEEMDRVAGQLLDTADLETLRLLVVVPGGEGTGLAVMAATGVKRGKVVERPVELADLAPTICYLAELPVPSACEGGIVYQALEDPDAKMLELQSVRRNYDRLRRSSGGAPMC